MSDPSDKLNDAIDQLDATDQLDLEQRYSDWQSLGQGGMGTVVVAHDAMLDKKVAIKLLHGDVDSRTVVRFQQEAKVLSKLDHEFIVRIWDFHYSKRGQLFLVMEHVVGSSLESILNDNGRLPPEEALRIAIQLTQALKHAHSQGIIHRDLKPANVMLDSERNAKILDFGIAKLLSTSEIFGTLTRAGQLIGSPLYMSPEQLRGEAASELSDVYGLGLLLFTMIAGQPPFAGDNLMESLQQRLTESAPSLQLYVENSKLCAGLDTIIARALHPDPEQRLATMAEFEVELAALQSATAEPPSSVNITEVNPRVVVKSGKTKLVVGAMIVSLVALALAATVMTISPTKQIAAKIATDDASKLVPDNVSELVKPRIHPQRKNKPGTESPAPIAGFTIVEFNFWLAPDPITEDDLKRLLGSSVKRLSFENESVTSETLAQLHSLKLEGLNLRNSTINDEDLKQVCEITTLRWLDLSDTAITHQGIKYLRPLSDLFRLELKGCPGITNRVIPELRNFPKLRNLQVSSSGFTRDGVILLQDFPTLTKVGFGGLNITDDDIIGFHDLQNVDLSGCANITNKSLRHFATQESLVNLDVARCPNLKKEDIRLFRKTVGRQFKHLRFGQRDKAKVNNAMNLFSDPEL